jgi:hypothetical protein
MGAKISRGREPAASFCPEFFCPMAWGIADTQPRQLGRKEREEAKKGQRREVAKGAEVAGKAETGPATLARSRLRDQSPRDRCSAPAFSSLVVFFGQPPAWLRASAAAREI